MKKMKMKLETLKITSFITDAKALMGGSLQTGNTFENSCDIETRFGPICNSNFNQCED